jgi:hypothetical protein
MVEVQRQKLPISLTALPQWTAVPRMVFGFPRGPRWHPVRPGPVVRLLLALGIVGSPIGIIVHLVSMFGGDPAPRTR